MEVAAAVDAEAAEAIVAATVPQAVVVAVVINQKNSG